MAIRIFATEKNNAYGTRSFLLIVTMRRPPVLRNYAKRRTSNAFSVCRMLTAIMVSVKMRNALTVVQMRTVQSRRHFATLRTTIVWNALKITIARENKSATITCVHPDKMISPPRFWIGSRPCPRVPTHHIVSSTARAQLSFFANSAEEGTPGRRRRVVLLQPQD